MTLKEIIKRQIFTRIPWIRLEAPIRNTEDARSASAYIEVIEQFRVEANPRYEPRDGKTYCNIFVWDVTAAMNAEIPHWVCPDGSPGGPGVAHAARQNCNAMYSWLIKHGQSCGWKKLSQEAQAQVLADEGRPVIAIWPNPDPDGHGHLVIIRPWMQGDDEITCAQAGESSFSKGTLSVAFRRGTPEFWYHE
jgi:hypothetical protein